LEASLPPGGAGSEWGDELLLFLDRKPRYSRALATFDPLRGSWLFGIIDRLPSPSSTTGEAGIRVRPTLALFLALQTIPVLFCLSGRVALGGRFDGPGGLASDLDHWVPRLTFVVACLLLVSARRLFGELITDLVDRGVVSPALTSFDPAVAARGRLLRGLEWISRLGGKRDLAILGLLLLDMAWVYAVFLGDGRPTWHGSPATPGSLFYPLRVGAEQPNLSGLWVFLVYNQFLNYSFFVMFRLFVLFACLCQAIADDEGLRLVPTHPDGVGGLLAIGQMSLFLSLFTFLLGLNLAGITLGEIVLSKVFADTAARSVNLRLIAGQWLGYLSIGTLLFFLPILSLRQRMASAKRSYLTSADRLYAATDARHRAALEDGAFSAERLQGQTALWSLIKSAREMAVWPFDQGTFLRFAGVLFTPLAPLLADQASRLFATLKALFHLPG
jgi:hypothetical protein